MSIQQNQVNKKLVWDFWYQLQNSAPNTWITAAEEAMSASSLWYGPDPINELHGPTSFITEFWQPLNASFAHLKRETFVFFGGISNGRRDGNISKDGRKWVTGTGMLNGIFVEDYLGIPATGKPVSIRWGEFCCIENNKIVESYFLIDLIDLMESAGYDVISPVLGVRGQYLQPLLGDGVLLGEQPKAESDYSLKHIRSFIYEGLNSYDENNLESMGMADYFTEELCWYGPGGIGSCYGLKAFEDFHQQPWLVAFPDREVQDLDALIAEGPYSGGPGWDGVRATHTGPYKGVQPTNNDISINGLDWWKRVDDHLTENWVFVDMVHLFRQFDVDIFALLKAQIKAKG